MYLSQQRKTFAYGLSLLKTITHACFIDAFLRERTVWKGTSRELSDVRWQQVLRGSLAKERCPCWNHPSAQFHPFATKPTWCFQELWNACVSPSVHVPAQWLKASCVCQEMEIFYYPSQPKKLFWCLLKGIGEFCPGWKVAHKAAGCGGWAGGGIMCSPEGMQAPR